MGISPSPSFSLGAGLHNAGDRQVACRRESQVRSRRTSASTTSEASCRCPTCTAEWRDPNFNPEIALEPNPHRIFGGSAVQ